MEAQNDIKSSIQGTMETQGLVLFIYLFILSQQGNPLLKFFLLYV